PTQAVECAPAGSGPRRSTTAVTWVRWASSSRARAWSSGPQPTSAADLGENVLARSIKYHRPRSAYCFAAACSHCLMRVDGLPNVYTCRTPARAGMRLERQNAFPSAKVDLFGTIDWFFPRGLDHHEMF